MYATREDFESAEKMLKQFEVTKEKLISAWSEAFYRGSVGYFTKADAHDRACEKFKREVQCFSYHELEDYKNSIKEALQVL